MNTPKLLALILALVVVATWEYSQRPVKHAAGVLVAEAPQQSDLDATTPSLVHGDITVKPLAKFALSARVLSRTDYHWDRGAALSPVDLALGWGRMSDSAIIEKIDISQSSRFYFWHVNDFPIPKQEIIESSANMHMIPADSRVARAIKQSREGDIISLDGYLVEADWPTGGKWVSSLTRSDSGDGACELVWVEHFDIAPR